MRLLPIVPLLSGLALACAPAAPSGPDAGPVRKQIIFDFGGQLRIHPVETAWRTDEGTLDQVPSLEGLTVKVEDATSAKAGRPALKTVTSTADGAWSAPEVDVALVSIAIVTSVEGPGLFNSAFGIQRGRPTASKLDLVTWVLTEAFVDHLAKAARGDALDAQTEFKAHGFSFGQITTPSGEPVAGAKLALVQSTGPLEFTGTEEVKLYYLNDDLSGLNATAATGAKGLFILENAGDATDYTAILGDRKFENRLSGSREEAVVSFFIAEKPQ